MLTSYRLTFRPFWYPRVNGERVRLQLLFHYDQLEINYTSRARLRTFNGHNHIARSYDVKSYVIGQAGTAQRSDPDLAQVGGVVVETFTLPVDPFLHLQRVGYACMDEGGFPLDSVDAENIEYFYDETARPSLLLRKQELAVAATVPPTSQSTAVMLFVTSPALILFTCASSALRGTTSSLLPLRFVTLLLLKPALTSHRLRASSVLRTLAVPTLLADLMVFSITGSPTSMSPRIHAREMNVLWRLAGVALSSSMRFT